MYKIASICLFATVTAVWPAQAQGCNPRYPATCIGQPYSGGDFTPRGPSAAQQQQENELRRLQLEQAQEQQREQERQKAVLEQMQQNDRNAEQQRRDAQIEEMRRQFERQQAETIRRSGF